MKLTDEGKEIYEQIKDSIEDWDDRFVFELEALSNSIALYGKAAEDVNENEYFIQFKTGHQQKSVSYQVMEKEYNNIIKHGPKFGMNPTDLKKLTGGKEKPKDPLKL